MHAIRATSAAALALAALSLAATPVAADDSSFNVAVSPSTIAAGGEVSLQASGCSNPESITVTEGFFKQVSFSSSGAGNASVDWNVQQGAVRSVTFHCGASKDTVSVTIANGRPDSTPVPQGVKAGIGGSVGGFDLQEVALGGALIAGALGTAYVVARRRTGDKSA